jgi:glycosyltransferase involved in cell wall biosynthesis
MIKLLSVVIPMYNEEATVGDLIKRVLGVQLTNGIKMEVIVVDDFSTDTSVQIVESFEVKLIKHEKNRGKGTAIRSGIEYANGDYIVIQDADLEYDPNEYNILLEPVITSGADVVYGSRFMGGKPHRILFYWHSLGNKFLTSLSNMFTNLNLTDMETCYKLFRKEVIQSIKLKENRFGFEPEVTAKISKIKNIKIFEVGISYNGRTYDDGKKINWKDGIRAIYCILRYNLLN